MLGYVSQHSTPLLSLLVMKIARYHFSSEHSVSSISSLWVWSARIYLPKILYLHSSGHILVFFESLLSLVYSTLWVLVFFETWNKLYVPVATSVLWMYMFFHTRTVLYVPVATAGCLRLLGKSLYLK